MSLPNTAEVFDVVAKYRRSIGKLCAGELHTVTRIASKTDNYGI